MAAYENFQFGEYEFRIWPNGAWACRFKRNVKRLPASPAIGGRNDS